VTLVEEKRGLLKGRFLLEKVSIEGGGGGGGEGINFARGPHCLEGQAAINLGLHLEGIIFKGLSSHSGEKDKGSPIRGREFLTMRGKGCRPRRGA